MTALDLARKLCVVHGEDGHVRVCPTGMDRCPCDAAAELDAIPADAAKQVGALVELMKTLREKVDWLVSERKRAYFEKRRRRT